MDPIIKIENLSKQYRLGNVGTGTLSHDLNRWWANIRGKEDPFLKIGETNTQNTKGASDYVWALKDINLEVMPGEVLGIIGKNGAGKSTLLKLLSRVTAPTTGSIKARGRIASLLEVGTGFHPELTGRENIFLNGAILGMTKAEIRSKFDEIVDFAGVERYIDTPVKRYSSGMYVRLAFAIAAHLEPEILVVDEVLAVGDAEFQKKAIGKMQDVSRTDGRTVLFVSHNMASIRGLCNKTLVLNNGIVGMPPIETSEAILYYVENNLIVNFDLKNRTDRKGLGNIKIIDFYITNENEKKTDTLLSGQKAIFHIVCKTSKDNLKDITSAFSIQKADGELVSLLSNELTKQQFKLGLTGEYTLSCTIDKIPLMIGHFSGNIMIRQKGEIEDWIQTAFSFQVINGDFFSTGQSIPSSHNGFLINQNWTN